MKLFASAALRQNLYQKTGEYTPCPRGSASPDLSHGAGGGCGHVGGPTAARRSAHCFMMATYLPKQAGGEAASLHRCNFIRALPGCWALSLCGNADASCRGWPSAAIPPLRSRVFLPKDDFRANDITFALKI